MVGQNDGKAGKYKEQIQEEKIKKIQSYLCMCVGTLPLLCISNDVLNPGVKLEPWTQRVALLCITPNPIKQKFIMNAI
jgi:hypothetical protein